MRTAGCIAGAILTAFAAIAAGPPTIHYSLPLQSVFTPGSQTIGLYLKVRIDDGPVFRLLLDSGAQHVVLDHRAAAKAGRTKGSAFELVGVGAPAKNCKRVAPAKLTIGDLTMTNIEILAAEGQLLEGVDGVVPMSLFADFLLRLDVPHRTLELDPYPANAPASGAGYLPARADNRLFFLRTVVNDAPPGYMLLDTGATFSALSPAAARASRNFWSLGGGLALLGSAGTVEAFPLGPGVRFRCGENDFLADPVVVVDLSDFTRHHPFEVTGILGYPALLHSIVTMDYRDSMIRIERK
jgi:predicted aspartyl protease